MTGTLCLRHRQRTRPVDLRLLRHITRTLLADYFRESHVELCIHLVAAQEMARLNEKFLRHSGSTDVITFNYAENLGQASHLPRKSPTTRMRPCAPFTLHTSPPNRGRRDACPTLSGEIFICLDDAVAQARQFRTSWQSELVRYLVHGLLHLQGFDDSEPAARKKMKSEENRLVRLLASRFPLLKLARPNRESRITNRKSH